MSTTTLTRCFVATAAAIATCLGGAPAAFAGSAQASPSHRTTVNGWYTDLLGRGAAEDSDSRYWVDQLDAGADPSRLAYDITHSREAVTRTVARYYIDYLGRTPDPGAAYWIDGVVAGRFPLEWVEQNVLASEEFYASRYQASTTVRGWYQYVLGAAPLAPYTSDAEVDYWLSRWRAVGRLGALREMWYSPEPVRYRIYRHYGGLLRRGADPAGVDYWYSREVASDDRVHAQIAGTEEYAMWAETGTPRN